MPCLFFIRAIKCERQKKNIYFTFSAHKTKRTALTIYAWCCRFIWQQNIPRTRNPLPQNDVKRRTGIQEGDFNEICPCIYIQISDKNSSPWCNTLQLGCCAKGSPILKLATEYIWTNFILHTVSRQCASAILCHQQSVCPFRFAFDARHNKNLIWKYIPDHLQ